MKLEPTCWPSGIASWKTTWRNTWRWMSARVPPTPLAEQCAPNIWQLLTVLRSPKMGWQRGALLGASSVVPRLSLRGHSVELWVVLLHNRTWPTLRRARRTRYLSRHLLRCTRVPLIMEVSGRRLKSALAPPIFPTFPINLPWAVTFFGCFLLSFFVYSSHLLLLDQFFSSFYLVIKCFCLTLFTCFFVCFLMRVHFLQKILK